MSDKHFAAPRLVLQPASAERAWLRGAKKSSSLSFAGSVDKWLGSHLCLCQSIHAHD
jgi:hypothetical protein